MFSRGSVRKPIFYRVAQRFLGTDIEETCGTRTSKESDEVAIVIPKYSF